MYEEKEVIFFGFLVYFAQVTAN